MKMYVWLHTSWDFFEIVNYTTHGRVQSTSDIYIRGVDLLAVLSLPKTSKKKPYKFTDYHLLLESSRQDKKMEDEHSCTLASA